MGFFSGEDIVTVNVTVVKLVDAIPNTLADAIGVAILGGSSIPNYVFLNALNGFSSKARRYLNYGINDFIYQLPSGTTSNSEINPDTVGSVIAGIVGEPVKIHSAFLSLPSTQYFAYEFVQTLGDYDYSDGTVVINGITYTYTGYEVIDGLLVVSLFDSTTTSVITRSTSAPINTVYYHASYHLISQEPTNDSIFWTYDPSLGTYPTLDIQGNNLALSSFYPIVPLINNKIFANHNTNSEQYITSRTILKKLQLDLDDMIGSLKESPSIEDIDDSYFMFGLNPLTKEEASLEYLFLYFGFLFDTNDNKSSFLNSEIAVKTPVPREPITGEIIGDFPPTFVSTVSLTINEQDLDVVIGYNYIDKTEHVGSISSTGAAFTSSVLYKPTEYVLVEIDSFNSLLNEAATIRVPIDRSTITINKQNNDGTFTRLTIYGFSHVSSILAFGEYNTVINKLEPDAVDAVYIPIDHTVLTQMSAFKEEAALMDGMILVVQAAQETHLEWYETAFFGFLVKIVITVVSIYFGPVAGSLSDFLAQSAATIIFEIVKSILTSIVTGIVLEYLAEEVGGFGAILIAAVAMYAFNSFGKDGFSIGEMPLAETLLKAVAAVGKGMNLDNQIRAEDLANELDIYSHNVEQRSEEIEQANALLNAGRPGNPYLITHAIFSSDFNESPDAYYERTLNQNPGVLVLDSIDAFYESALALPEANATDRILFA